MTEAGNPVAADEFQHFLRTAWQKSDLARRRGTDSNSLWLNIGGATLRLDFAGEAMIPNILPALAHLQVPPCASADLTISVWDSRSTGVNMPPPPWLATDYIARGEIRNVSTDQDVEVAYHPGSGVLSMLQGDRKRGMIWMHDAGNCPYWERAAPLRSLLNWWCSGRGQQLVHGAAVGTAAGAILLTAKGGSGKSTTALNALLAGLDYIGDDYVLCDRTESGVHVHSLFNTAKLDAKSLERLPELRGRLDNGDRLGEEKGVVYTHKHFPGSVCRSRPLRAIVIPRVAGGHTSRLLPLRSALAFLALSPTTVFQLPGAGESALTFLRQLVEDLPCYQLDLGGDPRHTVSLIRQLAEAQL